MNIIFKMDLPCSKLVVANAQLGVAAYIHQANGQENISRKSVLQFADAVMETTDRIHDAAEVGDFMVEVSEDELLHLMCAVRCTFEMFISAKLDTMKEIIDSVSMEMKTGIKAETINRRRLAHASHIILDFFECHAPITLYDAWINERRNAAKDMLDQLASCVNGEDD